MHCTASLLVLLASIGLLHAAPGTITTTTTASASSASFQRRSITSDASAPGHLSRRYIVGLDENHERQSSNGRFVNGIGYTFDRGLQWGRNLGPGGWGFNGVGSWQVDVPVFGLKFGGAAGPGNVQVPW